MSIAIYCSFEKIAYCISIASVSLLDENEIKKFFGWINLGPMYIKENNSKRAKIVHHLSLLQEIKSKNFKNK